MAVWTAILGTWLSLCGPALGQEPAPTFSAGVAVGNIDSLELDEASGCAASRRFPGIIYTHNDHGDRPRIFAVNTSDATVVAVLEISPALHYDWEDIAVGPCARGEKTTCIYILDDGEYRNDDKRTIYKVAEPDALVHQTLAPMQELVYNWTEHGSGTLMVDAQATLYVISNILGGRGMIVAIDPQDWGQTEAIFLSSGSYFAMESTHHDPAGGDISPDGTEVLVKNREEAYYWRPADHDIQAALTRPGSQIPLEKERLGEAICWSADATAYYTLGEGTHSPLYMYTRM